MVFHEWIDSVPMKAEMHAELQRRSRRSGERIIANQMNVSKMDGDIHTQQQQKTVEIGVHWCLWWICAQNK